MSERKKKPTLEQIRTLHHFDLPTIAMTAEVGTKDVYQALLLHPIYRVQAEKIVKALAHHIGLDIMLKDVDIVVWEDYQVLWIVRASANEHTSITDEYTFVYARSQEHAATLTKHWIEQLPHLPYCYFTACPEGFTIGDISIPGHIQAEENIDSN